MYGCTNTLERLKITYSQDTTLIPLRISGELARLLAPLSDIELRRIGSDNDGGYLVESLSFSDSKVLLSGGYGDDFSFEKSSLTFSNFQSVYLYDYSISWKTIFSDLFTKLPLSLILHLFGRIHNSCSRFTKNMLEFSKMTIHPRVHYLRKMLTSQISTPLSGVQIASLDEALDLATHNLSSGSEIYLKLDIEGSEYDLIESIVRNADLISGLVMEFHAIDKNYDLFLDALSKLNASFLVAHVHVNNFGKLSVDGLPSVLEITFTKLEYSINRTLKDCCWHSSDQPNDASSPDYEIFLQP